MGDQHKIQRWFPDKNQQNQIKIFGSSKLKTDSISFSHNLIEKSILIMTRNKLY
jgi:hypothetical protein